MLTKKPQISGEQYIMNYYDNLMKLTDKSKFWVKINGGKATCGFCNEEWISGHDHCMCQIRTK